jgi:hypothetical protein
MRVIEIHAAGGFPSLVLDSKKEFARNYGLQGRILAAFRAGACPEVLGYLKTNLTDLANHYHALYQDPRTSKKSRPISSRRCTGIGSSSPPSRWRANRRPSITSWRTCFWKTGRSTRRQWNTKDRV